MDISDAEVRSQMRMHLQFAMQDRHGSLGRNHEVDWDTLSVLNTGFAISMEKPVAFRTAHQWWRHAFQKVSNTFKDAGKLFRMTGCEAAPPGARPILEDHPTALRTGNTGLPAPSSLAVPLVTGVSSTPLPSASGAVAVSWPRYPARRLAGGCADDIGGALASFKLLKIIKPVFDKASLA